MYPANVGTIAIINIPCRNHVDEIFDRHRPDDVTSPGFIAIIEAYYQDHDRECKDSQNSWRDMESQ